MTPEQEQWLKDLDKSLSEMSDEECRKAYEECEKHIGPTIKEFCEWNNIPYND